MSSGASTSVDYEGRKPLDRRVLANAIVRIVRVDAAMYSLHQFVVFVPAVCQSVFGKNRDSDQTQRDIWNVRREQIDRLWWAFQIAVRSKSRAGACEWNPGKRKGESIFTGNR